MPTTQTPLTYQQLKQLTKEYQKLADWTTVRDFCAQVYGPGRAAEVELETNGEYNDEGGTNYSVESLAATDAQGKDLEFDLTLPFWTHLLKEENSDDDEEDEEEDDPQDAALDALKDWYPWKDEDKALLAANGWVKWEDLPCDVHTGESGTYDLTTPPAISFPVVVALSPVIDSGESTV